MVHFLKGSIKFLRAFMCFYNFKCYCFPLRFLEHLKEFVVLYFIHLSFPHSALLTSILFVNIVWKMISSLISTLNRNVEASKQHIILLFSGFYVLCLILYVYIVPFFYFPCCSTLISINCIFILFLLAHIT